MLLHSANGYGEILHATTEQVLEKVKLPSTSWMLVSHKSCNCSLGDSELWLSCHVA